MKKNEIIKKIKHGLKIAVASTLLAVSLTSCAPLQQNFSSQEEIQEVAEALDCDLSYIMKENDDFTRMRHNGGEPIYVCFDEGYSEDLKSKAKESLDYVFGIVGKINSNYHYKIVDKAEFDLKGRKTKIFYTFGEHVSSYKQYSTVSTGHLEIHSAWYNFATDNPVYFYYELNLNPDKIKEIGEKDIESSLNHELLHAFGLGDVYTDLLRKTTDKFYGNTYMKHGFNFEMITPNDLACLISLYADENCDIEKMKVELAKYEEKFYAHYADLCKNKAPTEEEIIADDFEFTTAVIAEDLDKTLHGYEYRVTFKGDSYLFEIYDYFSKELIESCNGFATNQKGVVVLKNVELKTGLKPNNKVESFSGGYVQDLAILSKDGKTALYDYFNNNIIFGKMDILEKSLTN